MYEVVCIILTTYINGSRCKNCVSHLCQHATLVYIILVTLFSNDTFCSLIFEECVGSVVLLWIMISEGWGLLYSREPWYLKGGVCWYCCEPLYVLILIYLTFYQVISNFHFKLYQDLSHSTLYEDSTTVYWHEIQEKSRCYNCIHSFKRHYKMKF